MTRRLPIKRALLSVSNKCGLIEFAAALASFGIELITTGGTSRYLCDAGLSVTEVSDLTGFPEIMDGRVKTLHPLIHAGILGRRDEHANDASRHTVSWIDLVVVNLYPFAENPSIETIDVGGPTLLRAGAKNNEWVAVASSPNQYPEIINEITSQGGLSDETRQRLAAVAFAHTAGYDLMIAAHFSPIRLRYGENPQQSAHAILLNSALPGILNAKQLQGKTLSYNNILDADAAWSCLQEFSAPTGVIIKHNNPCGIASAQTIEQAYKLAWAVDSLSAFGGIVALNRPCSDALAQQLSEVFLEVIIAPEFTPGALEIFKQKNNLRLLTLPWQTEPGPMTEVRSIQGGLLLQDRDNTSLSSHDMKIVTHIAPTEAQLQAMLFSWKVVKHLKSNAIVISDEQKILSAGIGQTSRLASVEIALSKLVTPPTNAVLASDAFFPFRDSIDHIAKAGIKAIIQPGGSIKDEEVIAACNEHGITMVFTGVRCFKH